MAEFGKSVSSEPKKLRIIDYADFVRGKSCVYVVPYSCSNKKTEEVNRRNAIELAELLVACKDADLHKYDILKWNCERFVLVCKTGEYQQSEQINDVLPWLKPGVS